MVEDNSWHLDKRLNISHMLTTLVIAVGIVTYMGDIKQQVNSNSQEIKHEKEMRQIEAKHIRDTVDSINSKVDKNGFKLDRLLETVNNK